MHPHLRIVKHRSIHRLAILVGAALALAAVSVPGEAQPRGGFTSGGGISRSTGGFATFGVPAPRVHAPPRFHSHPVHVHRPPRVFFGSSVIIGSGVYYGPWWYRPWPAYPYYGWYEPPYLPPLVTLESGVTYIEKPRDDGAPAAGELAPGYWYWCYEPRGYHPDVSECPGGWHPVPPRAQ